MMPRPMSDDRTALRHVIWLGGASRVGKSTLSRLLAGTWDLRIYNLDWHHVREHRERAGPEMRWWDERTPDQRWLDPSAEEVLARSRTSWEEGFPLVLDDLRALPPTRTVLAEGPGAFPWLVAPYLSDPRQALFLVPTPEWWDRVLARRRRDNPPEHRFGYGTRDPEAATARLKYRDMGLAEMIVRACRELGLRCETLDGSLDVADGVALLAQHFRPFLPQTPNV
jgi:hypothetical protein